MPAPAPRRRRPGHAAPPRARQRPGRGRVALIRSVADTRIRVGEPAGLVRRTDGSGQAGHRVARRGRSGSLGHARHICHSAHFSPTGNVGKRHDFPPRWQGSSPPVGGRSGGSGGVPGCRGAGRGGAREPVAGAPRPHPGPAPGAAGRDRHRAGGALPRLDRRADRAEPPRPAGHPAPRAGHHHPGGGLRGSACRQHVPKHHPRHAHKKHKKPPLLLAPDDSPEGMARRGPHPAAGARPRRADGPPLRRTSSAGAGRSPGRSRGGSSAASPSTARWA